MVELKTQPTSVSVRDFIAQVENDTRRKDAEILLRLFARVTGWKAKMWGPTIIGFGAYHYTYESGHSGTMCAVGFSPRKANLVVYMTDDFTDYAELRGQLGKVKAGKACLYINKLADIDTRVLEKMIAKSIVAMNKSWPVTAS